GYFNDSSGNGFTLSGVPDNANGPIETAIPGSGPGSNFPETIPSEGVGSNDQMTWFGTTRSRNFTVADNTLFDSASFTIEAFVHQEARADTSYIASHWASDPSERSWGFGVNSSGRLFAVLSADGNNATAYTATASLTLTTGVDYYTGASFDDNTGNLTFHFQDLQNGGELLSETINTGTSLHTGSSADFQIGTYNNSEGNRRWQGYMDEVRLSDTVLSGSELMVIPEPASLFLVLGGLLTVWAFKRRR
nr:PEP-CTERM sorting domain-containing protein [Kiritimatiellia bacterium]